MPVFTIWLLIGGGGAEIRSNRIQKGMDPIVISKTHVGAFCKIEESMCGIFSFSLSDFVGIINRQVCARFYGNFEIIRSLSAEVANKV